MFVSLFVASLAFAAQSDASADSDIAPQVRRLVRQLNAQKLVQRDEAERMLIELGPAILVLLPKRAVRTPPEVTERLGRVRDRLERAAAEDAIQASRVSLQGEMLLSEFFAALERQTGNRIVDYRDKFGQQKVDTRVTVDLEKAPFWQALDRVLDQVEMVTYSYSGLANTLAVVSRDPGQLPACDRVMYSGLFRFEATQVRAVRDLRNPQNHVLQLNIEITWEPRITPIKLDQRLDWISMTDGAGEPLPVDAREHTLEVPTVSNVSAVEMNLPLPMPDKRIDRIKSLKGKLMALVPGRVATFEFGGLAELRNSRQRKAGVSVTFQQFRKNVDLYEARILVEFDKTSGALESHRGWIYNNDAYFVTPDGKRKDHDGLEKTREEANAIGFSYKLVLDGNSDDYKFVYKTPAAIVSVPVEYELRDIILP